MKKALLTATVQQHFTSFHMRYIAMLRESGYQVDVAARDVLGGEIHERLSAAVDDIYDIPFERSPFSLGNIEAYKQLKSVIDTNDYDFVHCNTPVGGILTRLAARKARKKGTKVIYTAHGLHFYKGAPKLNWLIFYPIEKLFGRLFCDCLITICDEDEATARKHKLCKTIRRIHGIGGDDVRFAVCSDEEKLNLRESYGFDKNCKICLCTGELNQNKNQQLLINALPAVVTAYPDFKLMFAGIGDNEENLRELAKELNVENNIAFLGFRTDVDKLVKMSDFVVSASLREGLPVNIIEGMLNAKPAVVTHNRGHNELVEDGVSGMFVPFGDVSKVEQAFISFCSDDELCRKMGKAAYERSKKYSLQSVEKELNSIYNEIVFSKNDR